MSTPLNHYWANEYQIKSLEAKIGYNLDYILDNQHIVSEDVLDSFEQLLLNKKTLLQELSNPKHLRLVSG